jgi:hypothetical protein
MSDTGLFSGIYQHARSQAELLDRVLVRLHARTSRPVDEDRQQLATWLSSLEPSRSEDCAALFTRVLLGAQGAAFQNGWAEVGDALGRDPVPEPVIVRLEQLARVLEQEQAVALARLRGGS